MQRNDVASTSFRHHVPTRFLINQCQIITFLILKSDIIENSGIELRGVVLPVPSNQIKVSFTIILPFNLVHLRFFSCFTQKLKEKVGGLLGWGGKGMLPPPPFKLLRRPPPSMPPPPLPTPMYESAIFPPLFQRFPLECTVQKLRRVSSTLANSHDNLARDEEFHAKTGVQTMDIRKP